MLVHFAAVEIGVVAVPRILQSFSCIFEFHRDTGLTWTGGRSVVVLRWCEKLEHFTRPMTLFIYLCWQRIWPR